MADHAAHGEAELPAPPDQVATLLVALLIGLEMQSRVDPDAVPDATAVTGLRGADRLPAHRRPGQVSRPEPWPRTPADRSAPRQPSDPTADPTPATR